MSGVYPQQESFNTLQAVQLRLDAGSNLHLFQNDFIPLITSVPADFVEANFSGYVIHPLAGAWSAPFLDVDNRYTIETLEYLYHQDGGAVSNTIYGWYITSGAELVLAWRYGIPIDMSPGSLDFTQKCRYRLGDCSTCP